MHFGDNLKNILEEAGISQSELARRCELSEQQISRFINGSQRNPGIQTVVAISTALGVSVGRLIFGEESEDKNKYLLEAINMLPIERQKVVRDVIKTYVAQSTAERIMGEPDE
ncbi:MAG TPA: helix-turn-helix transcriptional regulator [Cellvibrionaceae bacterium]|nr:helix-turn-helix transcriptional regulator [Cellvibrionaceae bacterium]